MQAFFDMVVATSGHFYLQPGEHGSHDDDYMRNTLSIIARTAPGLESFSLMDTHSMISSPATVALLSQALLHHTKLSALKLSAISPKPSGATSPSAAAVIFSSIPRLTSLTCLEINFERPGEDCKTVPPTKASADVLRGLAAAVSALPRLAEFSLGPLGLGDDGEDGGVGHKRRRVSAGSDSGEGGGVSLDPVIAALATAPALTSVALCSAVSDQAALMPCAGVRGTFAALQKLHLALWCSRGRPMGCRHLRWPLPVAPLPLRKLTMRLHDRFCLAQTVTEALQSLAGHPELTEVDVNLNVVPGLALDGIAEHMQRLQRVSRLDFSVSPAGHLSVGSVRALGDGLARMPALASVRLRLGEQSKTLYRHQQQEDPWVEFGEDEMVAEPWMEAGGGGGAGAVGAGEAAADGAAVGPPGAFGEVKDVELVFMRHIALLQTGGESAFFRVFPLRAFTRLTSLQLEFPGRGCDIRALRGCLPALTALESLSAGDLEVTSPAALEACLAPLVSLTRVELMVRPLDAAVVRAVARCAAKMRRLHELKLGSCNLPLRNAAGNWFQGLAALPGWGRYVFNCTAVAEDVGDRAATREQLLGRGAEVADDCRWVKFGNLE